MPPSTLRALFDELVDLDPAARAVRLDALALPADQSAELRAMLAFDALVAAPAAERERVLRALAPDDDVLARLRPMLASDGAWPDMLRGAAGEAIRRIDRDATASPLVGMRFGAFELVALIAEGGSSSVFRAVRDVGDGVQTVALKVLRTGLFSTDAQRRFRREQAILAQLEHPHIARLVEGGVSDAGIPYIAMEFVDGQPITRAADARSLGPRERLEWFATLCRAIAAAHAALVVHRDIKPSNVLITRDGGLKVLDFGIAKLLDDDSAAATRTLAMTPEYAAPEQFGRAPPTTATDVYALGLVLGELLTGRRLPPHRRASSAVAAGSDAPPGMPAVPALARLLRGDLDAILAMALAHDPKARYAGAAALGDDIARCLAREPVRARPLTRRYRAGRFVARHGVALAVAATLVLATFAALVAIVWQSQRAQRQAERAEEQAQRAEAVRDLLVSVFNAAGAELPRERRPGVEEIVEDATDRVMRDATLSAAARADLLPTLARVAHSVGANDRAVALLDLADGALDATYGAGSPQRLEATVLRADVELARAHPAQVRRLLDPLRDALAAASPRTGVAGLLTLGKAHIRQGEHDAGLALLRQAVRLAQRQPERAIDVRARIDEATALIDLQRFADGLAAVDAALAAWRDIGEPPSQAIVELHATIALAAEGAGDVPRAERAYRDAIALGDRYFDKPNPAAAWNVGMYGSFLTAQGRLDEAEPHLRRGLELRRKVFGDADPRTLNGLAGMGKLYAARRDYAEAVRWYTEGIDACAAARVDDVVCPRLLAFRARAQAGLARYDDAEADIERALELQRRRGGEDTPAFAFVLENRLAIAVKRQAWDDALATADRVLAAYGRSGGMVQSTLTVRFHRARALFELGRVDEALGEIRSVEPEYARLVPKGTSRFDMLALEARAFAGSRRMDEARDAARRALSLELPAGAKPAAYDAMRTLAQPP
ncbi:serine/threonine-protein kinase [Tahibacter soli]|uniref:Protein kinase n=1 Tax=Tahibacter soli TaxID=2983605 RepID=A0A9X4BME0_9GAMM|nr:serine/threonine-protein kinase [Tahibacter soli]MDC8016242.1 protein kinase [Tahibacter soli]